MVAVSPKIIADAFVALYYHILAKTPSLVHRFCKDNSKLVRVETDGSASTTTTMEAINEKIMSLNNGGKFEITSVDALESSNMDVHILVTGFETGSDNIVREFAQSFLLEPMPNENMGYYLLHDMFRYVGKTNQLAANQVPIKEIVEEAGVSGEVEDRSADLGIDAWVLCSGSP